jgi:SAM-dependent methyltransferase
MDLPATIETKLLPQGCRVCGHCEFAFTKILWPELVQEWQLTAAEAEYIDLQQGFHCTHCRSNLRSITLAYAIVRSQGHEGTLHSWIESVPARSTQMLEINEAGNLTRHLRRLPGHIFVSYPDVDMHSLPYPNDRFDLVVHSDTLEHVPNPVHALSECRRVLKPGGFLAFTVPLIVGRLSRSRDGLPPSYHGAPGENKTDYAVQTEFGADVWTYLFEAGFASISLVSLVYPASIALLARA